MGCFRGLLVMLGVFLVAWRPNIKNLVAGTDQMKFYVAGDIKYYNHDRLHASKWFVANQL